MTSRATPPTLSIGYAPIVKSHQQAAVTSNLPDYEQACAGFTWQDARGLLSGLPQGRGLNIAYEAVDRHVESGLAETTAIRWISRDDTIRDFTYADLRRLTNRFANVLTQLGV
jgi:acetyl-CoA synthetase